MVTYYFKNPEEALKRANGKPESSLDSLMVQLFNEVEYVWPRLGYPPLVTPFSQYVKNTALINLLAMAQNKPRFSTIDKDTWGMILGKMGKLPGELAPEIEEIAKERFNKDLETFREKAGAACGYVHTWYGMEELLPAVDGQLVAVTAPQGKTVEKGEIVALIQ